MDRLVDLILVRCHRFPMLSCLTYASQIADGWSRFDFDAIVRAADRVNRRRALTGVIAFDSVRILHILEGSPQEVGRMFGRILQNRRHRGVTELSRHRVGERSFPGTGMGIVPISSSCCPGRKTAGRSTPQPFPRGSTNLAQSVRCMIHVAAGSLALRETDGWKLCSGLPMPGALG